LRLLGFRIFGRARDGVLCAQGTRQLRHRVADRSSDRWRQHGFAYLKTSEGESYLRGEICDRNTCGAHVVDTLRYQAKAFLPYGKPFTVGSILKNAIRPSEHHPCTARKVRAAALLHHARSFAAEDERRLREGELTGANGMVAGRDADRGHAPQFFAVRD